MIGSIKKNCWFQNKHKAEWFPVCKMCLIMFGPNIFKEIKHFLRFLYAYNKK